MEEKKLTGYPSIDKPWLKYYSEEAINAELPECTIYQNIWQHNKEYLDDIALIYFGRKIPYRVLFEQVELCTTALELAGVGAGKRFALMLSCMPEASYLVLAASKIGAVVCFINPMVDRKQKIAQLSYCDAKLLFVMDTMLPYAADIMDTDGIEQVIIVPTINSMPQIISLIYKLKMWKKRKDFSVKKSDRFVSWNTFVQNKKSIADTPDDKMNLPFALVYSSGTTGIPKAIVLTNSGINATIEQYIHANSEIKRGNRFLTILPFYTSTGLIVCLLMPLCLGVTCILEPSYGSAPFYSTMTKQKVNYTFAPVSLWTSFIHKAEEKCLDLGYLQQPIIGGEVFPSELEAMFNSAFSKHNSKAKIQKGWGMCELGATATITSDIHNIEGSVGIPLPRVTVAAFDPYTNNELPYEQRGELRVITPSRMEGYQDNQKATEQFFYIDKNGKEWACTGDIGYIGKDGDVFVLGRMNDSYITNDGETIYLFDIENLVATDSAVELCEVVDMTVGGVPYPVVHIVLKDGEIFQWKTIIKRIHTACSKELLPNAIPYCYNIRKEFPLKKGSAKRDTAALKQERDGFVDADGNAVDFHA